MVDQVTQAEDVVLRVAGLRKHFPVTKGIILRKTIGWVRAVDDVNFTVKRGEAA